MQPDHRNTAADRAAEAFYGQSDDAFAKQVQEICRNDERLMQVFRRTRAAYLQDRGTPRI
ncbi:MULTISPECIES: hypothetical protein [Yoonia]|jgi:hypothetical protein|uniref:Uncharacterized protein n=1 Tax=Yoonia vestfoldensis SKA53 TaxID=314232 RepID=A3V4H2_9RHOB|nr:hypothetical protein [Yoonia vestfoldensis]EAQ06540.1 hypothetical protein SKA53_13371 [Yoonia vestfoldensis SKA53]